MTYPGMGSLSELMSNEERVERAALLRRPLGEEIWEKFGVDLEASWRVFGVFKDFF